MSAPSAVPVPPVPPATPPGPPEAQPPGRAQSAAVLLLLLVGAGLVGWRWYADHYRTRPTDRLPHAAHRIDLNRATKADLMQVPGVGPQLAERIVARREAVGPFARVEDLDGVHGIGPATLDKLRPWIVVETVEPDPPAAEPDRLSRPPAGTRHVTMKPDVSAGRVNLNTATAAELDGLPGIGPVLADRIIAERRRRPFASVDKLRRVSGIGPKKLDAIRPLVTVGE